MTAIRRNLAKATRLSLEEVFRLWLRQYAPEHFRRGAFARYTEAFAASRKRDLTEWQRRHAEDIERGLIDPEAVPLVRSGRFAEAILHGSYLFTGSNSRLRVRWARLPSYVTRRNRYSGFVPARAVVAWTEAEHEALKKAFAEWMLHHMQDLTDLKQLSRSYGRGTITT